MRYLLAVISGQAVRRSSLKTFCQKLELCRPCHLTVTGARVACVAAAIVALTVIATIDHERSAAAMSRDTASVFSRRTRALLLPGEPTGKADVGACDLFWWRRTILR